MCDPMPCFKLVYNYRDARGIVSFAPPTGFAVAYQPGVWTTAPVGGLLAFNTLAAAKAARDPISPATEDQVILRDQIGHLEIWEAEGEDLIPLPPGHYQGSRAWPPRVEDRATPGLTRALELLWSGGPFTERDQFDAGTVAYRRIRLLRLALPEEPQG